MRRVQIEGPITHRNLLVGWEPMEIEFAGNTFSGGSETWEARIRGPLAENPLVDWEPMEIELAGEALFWGISMRET